MVLGLRLKVLRGIGWMRGREKGMLKFGFFRGSREVEYVSFFFFLGFRGVLFFGGNWYFLVGLGFRFLDKSFLFGRVGGCYIVIFF